MSGNTKYGVYEDDAIHEGYKFKIDRSLYITEDDITDLISRPLEEVQMMREKSAKLEREMFDVAKRAAAAWEEKAADTIRFEHAIEYLQMPEVQHTSNQWVQGKYGHIDTISNKVYKMSVRIYEYENCRTGKPRWNVRWYVYTNSPRYGHNVKITEQERAFSDGESAEKYIRGRKKAYSHLFKEISPPIPDEYVEAFKLYGQLLPGYTTESMASEQEDII